MSDLDCGGCPLLAGASVNCVTGCEAPLGKMHWDADRFYRFRTLWQSYRSALSHPFGKDRNEDAQITSRVDAAFQALDQLSKEGV